MVALRAEWPKDKMTSLFLCWRSTTEKIVYIFQQDLSKRKHILASYRFLIRKTDEILRTLCLMHEGISFDRILPEQLGYFGRGCNELGCTPRSASVPYSLVWVSRSSGPVWAVALRSASVPHSLVWMSRSSDRPGLGCSPKVSLCPPQFSLDVEILRPGLGCSPKVSLCPPQFSLDVQILRPARSGL
jgi:hypothetical protein